MKPKQIELAPGVLITTVVDDQGVLPAYIPKIVDLIASGKLAAGPGMFGEIDVRHDDWCAALNGGFCRCNPDVSVRRQTS